MSTQVSVPNEFRLTTGYAPQLASQLRITSTQTNLVGMGGNLGVYLTGPL